VSIGHDEVAGLVPPVKHQDQQEVPHLVAGAQVVQLAWSHMTSHTRQHHHMASFSYRREEKGEEEEFYSQEEMSSIKQRQRVPDLGSSVPEPWRRRRERPEQPGSTSLEPWARRAANRKHINNHYIIVVHVAFI